MKNSSPLDYYFLGIDHSEILTTGLKGYSKKSAFEFLSTYIEAIESLTLPVTYVAAEGLSIITEELSKASEGVIDTSISEAIQSKARRIDVCLGAELSLCEIYSITPKKYPINSLMRGQSNLLGESVYLNLSSNSKLDFSLACIQIGLNQPTASAFHLMRTVEQVVRDLHAHFIEQKSDKPLVWGKLTQELRASASKPSDNILDLLDTIRVNYRNPTQHPDAFFNIDEAQDLLGQTIALLNMVASEVKNLNG